MIRILGVYTKCCRCGMRLLSKLQPQFPDFPVGGLDVNSICRACYEQGKAELLELAYRIEAEEMCP